MIVQLVLLVTGGVWTFIDRKSEKRKKTPMILIAIGSFMLAIFFMVLQPMMKK
jgi:heme/copper-type cytochrome/quinol oxidase subunit 3